MSRMPRQQQGEGLVPVTVMIPADLKRELLALAARERRSLSQLGRLAFERHLHAEVLAEDASAG